MAPAPKRLGLGRERRLRQTAEFMRVRQQGQRVTQGCLIANWMMLPDNAGSRIGVVTSRKLGKAHVRSRARRLLREVFRLHQFELRVPIALVLVARASIARRKLADVERDYLSFLRQAQLIRVNA